MNLKINHRLGVVDVTYFSNFQVTMKYDSLASTFSFNFLYEEKSRLHAEMACVSHFHEAILEHNGETLITGYLLSQAFNHGSKQELSQFAGYSKSGALEDCDIPISIFPLQSDGLTLRQIAKKIIDAFKLKMTVDPSVAADMDKVIPVTSSKDSQNAKSYLTEMCTQRKIIMTHDEKGNVVFTRAKTDVIPAFHVEDGQIGTEIKMVFSGQGLHSDITVLKESDIDGGNAGEYTLENPYVPIVTRPRVLTQTSGTDTSVQETAMNALAAELKDAISLKIETDRWQVNNKIIRPGIVISVYSPKNYIYKKTNFFVESVDYKGDSKLMTTTLNCVIPEVYNGKMPKNIFVDAHENLPRI